MIKRIAALLAVALAVISVSAAACPLEGGKASGTSQPAKPAKPTV